MLAILVILPLILAAFIILLMRKSTQSAAKYVALGASIISLALIALSYSNAVQLQTINWFSFNGYQFYISTSTAPLNMILLFIVGIMAPLVIAYSIGYMNAKSEQARYYAELCLFASAMMLFAISADFITMFIGWELLGITSYLLIGFWYGKEGAANAARKAITTILIGDILMLIALLMIWSTYGTFSFSALIQLAGQHNPTMAIALVLIMFAAFTKSAQFPFHEWLPDAMKGPTPVSSFLHSSTMVKAGVFLVAVLLPLFVAYNMLYMLLIFGIITAIIGITNALAETNIKRVLAYSTIEDLGLMFIALGTGSIIAAMMLFIAQTFYKALLFMSAGSIIKANGGEEDMLKLHNTKSHLLIFLPLIIAVASLAGLFPLSGFFGKAALEASVSGTPIYIILVILAFFSNVYIFRWLLIPLRKKNMAREYPAKLHYEITPKSMLIPMYVLALLVVICSLTWIYLPTYLLQYSTSRINIGYMELAVSLVVFIIALGLSYYAFYLKNFSIKPGYLYNILYNNILTNEFYAYVAQSFAFVSKAVEAFDNEFYSLIRGAAHDVGSFSEFIRKVENGNVNTYIAALLIGLVFILIIIML